MEKENNRTLIIPIIFFVVFLLGILVFYLYRNNKNAKDYLDKFNMQFTNRQVERIFNDDDPSTSSVLNNSNNSRDKVIIVVGDEKIYQKDYDVEFNEQLVGNKNNSPEIKTRILEKMVRDSLILQIAMEKKIVQKLEKDIYNSPNKDYFKRVNQVQLLETALQKKFTTNSSGIVFTAFIYNVSPGEYPYEKAKSIAYERVKKVYDQLVSKQISLNQAKDILSKDVDLKKIDPARETNIYFNFDTSKNKRVSLWEEFDAILLKTPRGSYTPIYTGKDPIDNGQGKFENKDVIYMFGYVEESQKAESSSLDEYINEIKKNYEIQFN